MTPDQRLARIVQLLKKAGVDSLVMGGHAVRYYGVDRSTMDFDLVTSVNSPDALRLKLKAVDELRGAREEPVWRHTDVARFEIGKLADGRAEYLEFWLRNHLLADFSELKACAEIGQYGGEAIPFLALSDLIRSKETERESDWQDISLLEEIQDERLLAGANDCSIDKAGILARLRSRRGMDEAIQKGMLGDRTALSRCLLKTTHPVTAAFLAPFLKEPAIQKTIASSVAGIDVMLASVEPGTSRHFALVEIVRRGYKRHAMELDRADKQNRLNKT